MLQQHANFFQKQINKLQQANKELEQCGRRLCVRTDVVPTVGNITQTSLIKETNFHIPDVVTDRAHRTGKGYNDKNIYARFTTFRQKAMLYLTRAI